ncbi:MAG: retroviral-like aspartic protease [bacterium]|nr:MAG: retroviral-like aspartic protease [bacterium]
MITKQIMVAGSKSQRQCEVLFDTGASTCFVREAIASELGQILKAPFPVAFKLGNKTVMRAEKTTDLFLDLRGHHISSMFLVIPELPYEVIVGADFFQKWKIKLDPAREDFIIDEKALEIMLV